MIVGYIIIFVLMVGLIDVWEVKCNMFIGSLIGCWGVINCFELEVKLFYVYCFDDVLVCLFNFGLGCDELFFSIGDGIGDVEVIGCY